MTNALNFYNILCVYYLKRSWFQSYVCAFFTTWSEQVMGVPEVSVFFRELSF